jgi:recombination protein RecA
MFGDGISREGEVIDLGTDLGIVEKKGSWYQWNGNMLGNGREATKKFLKENQGVAQEIETLIRSKAMANAHVVEAVSSIPGARVPVGDDAGDGHHDWGEEAVEPVQDETWVEDG